MISCQHCGTTVDEDVNFCPSCGHRLTVQAAAESNLASPKRPVKRWLVPGLLLIVVLLGLANYFKVLFRQFHPVIERQPSIVVEIQYGIQQQWRSRDIEVRIERGLISVPLKAVQEYKLVRFSDPEQVQTVPMLAYITPEGKVVTAMSASEQCGSTEFYLEGHNIHCARCPSYWNMSSLEAYACCQRFYPDPVPSKLVGDNLLIDPQIVRSWKSRM